MRKLLVLLSLFFIAAGTSAQSIYIHIDDPAFKGESVNPIFKDHLEALSTAFGVSNSATISSSGIPTVGKASFPDFSFTKNASKNSPIFYLYAASGNTNGRPIQKVEIKYVQPDPQGEDRIVYQVTLEGVFITSVSSSAADENCRECGFGMESITMTYAKITWSDPINGVVKGWDVAANKAL